MGVTRIFSPISNISDSRPCILKMKKFLPICVNGKTALRRRLEQNNACTFKLGAILKSIKKISDHRNEPTLPKMLAHVTSWKVHHLPPTNLGLHHSETSIQLIATPELAKLQICYTEQIMKLNFYNVKTYIHRKCLDIRNLPTQIFLQDPWHFATLKSIFSCQVSKQSAKARAKDIFDSLDKDGDGELTMNEFVDGYLVMMVDSWKVPGAADNDKDGLLYKEGPQKYWCREEWIDKVDKVDNQGSTGGQFCPRQDNTCFRSRRHKLR